MLLNSKEWPKESRMKSLLNEVDCQIDNLGVFSRKDFFYSIFLDRERAQMPILNGRKQTVHNNDNKRRKK